MVVLDTDHLSLLERRESVESRNLQARLDHLDSSFDERAATEFQRLRRSRLRIGTMDLKIAAIVLAHDATLLSRNLSDFRKVPGLKVEDWTLTSES
jgi:predicted nucleic acid-binding protein